ncbi:MAG: type II secretion system protein [Candidatus Neomarinimicrobiota bacterium]|nr:type II secretion system protein [Candidatus Neomarinimicrobiota bacterium]
MRKRAGFSGPFSFMNIKRLKAYTLFVVVLVTAIISILFSFALIKFSPDQKQIKYKNTVESLVQHIAYAQQIAQTENKYVSLIANSELRTYWLQSFSADGGDPENIPLWFNNAFEDIVELSSYTSALGFGDRDTITFTPWGLLESSNDILIELEGNDLNVSGITGHTSIVY